MSGDRDEGRGGSPSDGSGQEGRGGPAAGPDGSGGRRGLPYSRQVVVVIVLIVLGFYLMTRFGAGPEQMGCASGFADRVQWDQATVGARLTDLWTRGSEGLDVADARLTHLTAAWAGDGSIVQLELQGKTSAGLLVTVSSVGRSGSETMTVYSDTAVLGTSTTTSGPAPQATDVPVAVKGPPLSDVLASIDAVGFEGLKRAVSAVLGREEGLILELDPGGFSRPGLTVGEYADRLPAFTIEAGALSPADGAAALSSLVPAQAFSLAKAQLRGNGASAIKPPLAHVFVR